MVYNYPLYAIPAFWIIGTLPNVYALKLTKSSEEIDDYDNVSPREFTAKVRTSESTPFIAKYFRAIAAHQNSFEQIGLFSSAIVVGNLAKLPARKLNLYAGLYLTSRVLYNLLYINTTKKSISRLRSLTFISGVGICFTLFIQAGNALNRLAT